MLQNCRVCGGAMSRGQKAWHGVVGSVRAGVVVVVRNATTGAARSVRARMRSALCNPKERVPP